MRAMEPPPAPISIMSTTETFSGSPQPFDEAADAAGLEVEFVVRLRRPRPGTSSRWCRPCRRRRRDRGRRGWRDEGRGHGAGGGAGFDQADREVLRLAHRRDAAAGEHDVETARRSRCACSVGFQLFEVAAHAAAAHRRSRRPCWCVRIRGSRARPRPRGSDGRSGYRPRMISPARCSCAGVAVGMQEADGERLDRPRPRPASRTARCDGRFVQRQQHARHRRSRRSGISQAQMRAAPEWAASPGTGRRGRSGSPCRSRGCRGSPSVVSSPTLAPVRSMTVLVTSVVPWTMLCTSAGVRPASRRMRAMPSRMAREGSSGVVSSLPVCTMSRTRIVQHEVGEGAADIDADARRLGAMTSCASLPP